MKGIGFANMKVFKDYQWFDFKDITILTGTNNSGKSSIINAIQMLQDNINANNIKELLKTKFTLKNNQEKQGSIANFVNNEAESENDNRFLFSKQNGSFIYEITIEITNDGLESFGNISNIKCFDANTEEEVFHFFTPYKYTQEEYLNGFIKINYNYFIEKFNQKCANTENLLKRKLELDALIDGVNNNKNTIEEFNALAKEVAKEYNLYIYPTEIHNIEEDGTGNYFQAGDNYFVCTISNKPKSNDSDERESFKSNMVNISKEEFNKTHGRNFLEENVLFDKGGVLLPENKYNELYKNSYRNGIIDFSTFWSFDKEIEHEFRNFICELYLKDFEESCKLFFKDLTTILSNNKWFILGKDVKEINRMSLGGKISYLFKHASINKQEFNQYFNYDENNDMIEIENSNFIEELYEFLLIFKESYNKKIEESYYLDIDFSLDPFIPIEIDNLIDKDIEEVINNLDLNFNNLYVSSKRFEAKRQFTLNDQTDFTNLLKQIEGLGKDERIITNNFINKWLQEFKIADELILKPDTDTGKFKAILRNGNKETQLADFGLGTNQLLPVIFALSICEFDVEENRNLYYKSNKYFKRRTIMIEEPEANLHPAMQSKLADMLVEAAVKNNVQVIIETHSEYLIRKMQYLVAKDNFKVDKNETSISNKRVNIYYINAELDEMGKKAYEIKFKENGQLTEKFGKGFIDETTSLQFELYKLNNAQNN